MGASSRASRPTKILAFLGILACGLGSELYIDEDRSNCYGGEGDFFQFNAGTLQGDVISFNELRGRVVIALNVASF